MILKIAILLMLAGFPIEGREIINLESKKSNVGGFWGKLMYGGGGANDIKNVQSTTLITPTIVARQQQKKSNINGYLYAEPRQFHWGSELHHSTANPIIAGSELNMKVKPSGMKTKNNKLPEAVGGNKKVEKKIEEKSVVENQDLMFKLTSISKHPSHKKVNKKGSGSEYIAVVA